MSSAHPLLTGPARAARIAAEASRLPWQALEQLVHVDPAGRGLASFRTGQLPIDAGQLRAAAVHLATQAARVGIVTGFCIVTPHGVTAETDGPPGALFLARTLVALGVEVHLITDEYALPLVQFGCDQFGLGRTLLVEMPLEDGPPTALARTRNDDASCTKTDGWVADFLGSARGRGLTHLVSIERPGPSHSLASLAAQTREATPPVERFAAAVPAEDRDVCHTMRGVSINAYTAKAHRLFEAASQRQPATTTIGIGDGGNEIGMGRYAWEVLVDAVGTVAAPRSACRIATDFAIVAGVSNWGAYALALSLGRLCGAVELGRAWDACGQRTLVEQMVARTPAVDGLTLKCEPTVDGLPLDVYLRPLVEMRKLLGYAESPAD